jgi:hypothetical protein
MKQIVLTSITGLAAVAALADPGLHHHPHGISAGWIVLAAVLVALPVVALALKRIKK